MSDSTEEFQIESQEEQLEQNVQLAAKGVRLVTDTSLDDLTVTKPFTLLYTGRESSATTTMMTLAGRMQPKAGVVELTRADGEIVDRPRALARVIALAGVNEIDSLDRNVTVRSLVRESVAWANAWYKTTARDIAKIDRWNELCELMNFDENPHAQAGDLTPTARFNLRIMLALLTRKEPDMLLIDDIDQVHSLEIRQEIIAHLRDVSAQLPILIASSNPDVDGLFDETISLHTVKE